MMAHQQIIRKTVAGHQTTERHIPKETGLWEKLFNTIVTSERRLRLVYQVSYDRQDAHASSGI
jgi:hypothetical protein